MCLLNLFICPKLYLITSTYEYSNALIPSDQYTFCAKDDYFCDVVCIVLFVRRRSCKIKWKVVRKTNLLKKNRINYTTIIRKFSRPIVSVIRHSHSLVGKLSKRYCFPVIDIEEDIKCIVKVKVFVIIVFLTTITLFPPPGKPHWGGRQWDSRVVSSCCRENFACQSLPKFHSFLLQLKTLLLLLGETFRRAKVTNFSLSDENFARRKFRPIR